MKKIKKYQLCVNRSTGILSNMVNSLIRDGYQPYGPPQITVKNGENGKVQDEIYSQVMVIYEEDSEEKV